MPQTRAFTYAPLLWLSTTPIAIGAALGSIDSVALYWGQNSYGQGTGEFAQQRLVTYCENSDLDIIPMAFLSQITTGIGNTPVLNFANQQNNCTMFEGTGLIDCPQIGDDIKTCQSKYGKKILLSVGGATYTEGGFESEDAAVAAANMLWEMFGSVDPIDQGSALVVQQPGRRKRSVSTQQPFQDDGVISFDYGFTEPESTLKKRASSPRLRPFGDAVVDGFDLDFETPLTNSVPFAQQLRKRMDESAESTDKQYYLTSAPQCVYPDAAVGEMLSSDVKFDAIFVQFYNNYCGVNAFTGGAVNSTTNGTTLGARDSPYNFATWDKWAKETSANPDVKVYVGVPANTGAAGTGYLPATSLAPVLDYSRTFSSFGGVMMWDASQAYANKGFLGSVKATVKSSAKRNVALRWRA